jgi:hypothetical protein
VDEREEKGRERERKRASYWLREKEGRERDPSSIWP